MFELKRSRLRLLNNYSTSARSWLEAKDWIEVKLKTLHLVYLWYFIKFITDKFVPV